MSNYIKIVVKISNSPVVFENYYIPSDIKSVTVNQAGSNNTQTTEIVLVTVSGVTHTLELTKGIAAADARTIQQNMWDIIIKSANQGPDASGVTEQLSTNGIDGVTGGASVGFFKLLTAAGGGAVEADATMITIDADTVS